jgi:hypothetical protein
MPRRLTPVERTASVDIQVGRFIDSDGRVFGRINLIDAAVAAFVLLLIPVAYATFLLFRAPAPTISSVEPAPLTITEERAAQGTLLSGKFKVRGTGLRPVLRARVGSVDAVAFIFESPTSADVLVGDVAPGTHDLVLYDGVQEVARAANAITIAEMPSSGVARIALAGTLLDADENTLKALRPGVKLPTDADARLEVLAVGEPRKATLQINNRAETRIGAGAHRPALIAVRCETAPLQPRECAVGGTVLTQGVTFVLPGLSGNQRFMIDEVVPPAPPTRATLRLRLVGAADVLDLVNVGDVDQPHLAIDQRGAVVRAVGSRRRGLDPVAAMHYPAAGSVSAPDLVGSLDVTVDAGLDSAREGWRYRGDPVKAGGTFSLTTPRYTLRAIVISLDPHTGDSQ